MLTAGDLDVRRLADVDAAVQAAIGANDSRRDEALARLVAAVLTWRRGSVQTVTPGPDALEAPASREERRFVALCLLRVLAAKRDHFDSRDVRVPAMKLFDEALANDIYPLAQVEVRHQGHEKLIALADMYPTAERLVNEAIAELDSERPFQVLKEEFLRAIRSKRTAPLLAPFIPRGLFDTDLEDVLAGVLNFDEAEDEQLVEEYRQSLSDIDEYLGAATRARTTYSVRFCVQIASALRHRVDRAYEASDVSKPALVSLRTTEKKYPLHLTNTEFAILLEVNNQGPGVAFGTTVAVEAPEWLDVLDDHLSVGNLSPRSLVIAVRAQTAAAAQEHALQTRCEWTDADGRQRTSVEILELAAQNPSVDWDAARGRDPYSLEPVTTDEALIGRDEALDGLESMMAGESLGSSVIRGQKRVGKTSIARTLETRLKAHGDGTVVAYLEVGPYGGDSVASTVASLCPQICRKIRAAAGLPNYDIPPFSDGSAAALLEFVDEVTQSLGGSRLVLILDEFDELPPHLFGADDLSHSFFMTLRALSGRPNVGVILIGGEKMEFALALHGDALNKFADLRLDYVRLRDNLSDFAMLVREPSRAFLEIHDDAVSRLHAETQGHPYFTKMIMRTVWQTAVTSRDAHVTAREVDVAIHQARDTASPTSFQHYWSDGIRGSAEEQATISLERRRLLVALAEALRRRRPAADEAVLTQAEALGMSRVQASAVLREFVQRDVLVPANHAFDARIPFFGSWLREHGPLRIGAQLAESEILSALQRRQEELRVTSSEIRAVTDRWGTYQGVPVTPEEVRGWLDQFIGPEAQRLMFMLLQGIRFYGGALVGEKLAEAHTAIARGLSRPRDTIARGDVLVSYLDGAGKSGPEIARKYRQVNSIAYDSVVENAALSDALSSNSYRALVFVDDFVWSGDSACKDIERLPAGVFELAAASQLRIGVACVAGFEVGLKAIDRTFKERGVRARVHAGDVLGEEDRVFSRASRVFQAEDDRTQAHEIALRHGRVLDRRQPLGYEDAQAVVVFETRCPNNTLPILWAQRGDWHALFPRH